MADFSFCLQPHWLNIKVLDWKYAKFLQWRENNIISCCLRANYFFFAILEEDDKKYFNFSLDKESFNYYIKFLIVRYNYNEQKKCIFSITNYFTKKLFRFEKINSISNDWTTLEKNPRSIFYHFYYNNIIKYALRFQSDHINQLHCNNNTQNHWDRWSLEINDCRWLEITHSLSENR